MSIINVGASPRAAEPLAAFQNAVTVTPSDTNTFSFAVAIYVGGAGNVSVIPAGGGSAVTFAGVPAGTVLPCRASAVKATGTTATNLVALS